MNAMRQAMILQNLFSDRRIEAADLETPAFDRFGRRMPGNNSEDAV